MPNSDTWPRAVSVETLSNMDSARSCDSVISVNSVCSEDSMGHLSPEEKACLTYLEETIESLDIHEDSGFSNDEPDSGNFMQGDFPPLSYNKDKRDRRHANLTGVPDNAVSFPHSSAPDTSDVPSHIPPDPKPAAPVSASGSTTPVPAPLSTELSSSSGGDPQRATAEAELSVIPPPSDFMDEPVPPPSPQMVSAASAPAPKPTINLEAFRRRVSASSPLSPTSLSPTHVGSSPIGSAPVNATTVNPAPIRPAPVDHTPVSPTPQEKLAVEVSVPPPSNPSGAQTEASPGPVEPKSPPAVAPKPKKLPSNIILKPYKSTGGHESTMGHPSSGATDWPPMDPQKVRMEALRKLGLLKSEESEDSGSASKLFQTRRSWAPASPLSPTPPKSAPPVPYHSVYSSPPGHTSVPASAQTPSATPPVQALPDIIPVPAAFSDPGEEMSLGMRDQGSPHKKRNSLAASGVKSATLERSGLGLSSYMESLGQDKQTLGQLRNSRPRPASLGSRKDFSGAGGVARTEAGLEKHPPSSSQLSDSSKKLPRSQGISVLICPRAQDEESRRDALKKLGLLRD
ncbi:specifically androgen-regulated gene protein [Eucyclogobius newberryi]|uniref:specifically androgen-regulated gene protein n=1 Tax=Eucyclogobius newberryi TaxID=166745 RepID=UPI003B592890